MASKLYDYIAVAKSPYSASGEVSLSKGHLNILANTLGKSFTGSIKVSDIVSHNLVAHQDGRQQTSRVNFVAPAANTLYVIRVEFNNPNKSVNGDVLVNNDEVFRGREYKIRTTTIPPTQAGLVEQFVALMRNDGGLNADSIDAFATYLEVRFKLDSKIVDVSNTNLGSVSIPIYFIEPVGTDKEILNEDPDVDVTRAGGGEFNRYIITYREKSKHPSTNAEVSVDRTLAVFFENAGINAGAFSSGMVKVLSGTFTPTSDYFGV